MSDYTQWTQLWPIPFDTTLATELAAPVVDPMWLLARQMQFGEFRHDGGVSPVDIAVTYAAAQPSRMRAGTAAGTETVEIRLWRSPPEAVVEQETISTDGLDGLRLRAESGLYLQRLLRAAGLAPQAQAWAARCPFRMPAHAVVDDDTRDWFDTMAGRVPDGRVLGTVVGRVVTGQDTTIVLAPGELAVLTAWRAGTGIFLHSARDPGNWDPEQLEYRLSTGAVVGDGEVVLDAPEYVEGTLDWHAYDMGSVSLGLTGQTGIARIHRLPVPLRFTGMPCNRFWQFEDPTTNVDGLELFTRTDRPPTTAAMMALEFALSYGDDWCQIPIPLQAHTVCRIVSVEITDCFGGVTAAHPPAGRWNLFRHDDPAAPAGLGDVLVNTVPGLVLNGDTIEEVHLLRDEQANLAWAVETVVPHPLGGGLPAPPPPQPTPPPAGETGLRWTLSPPTLPRNWFPLLPVADSIGRLAVGTLWTARDARPAGRILTELLPDRRLHEGEVPSEGVQVTRCWQMTRAIDGSLHFWIGRAKTPRQTELAPAVRFDLVEG